MQNPPILPNEFKRRLLHFAKGLILHHFRDPHFGVSRGPNQPSAGFVVSGHVNLCLFLLSPPGMVSPDPSEWVLVSHAVEIPYPEKGSRTSPKGVNSRGARFAFCANLFLFTWFRQKWPNILLQTFAPPQICTVENQANWSTRAREGIYKGGGLPPTITHYRPPDDPCLASIARDLGSFGTSFLTHFGPILTHFGPF